MFLLACANKNSLLFAVNAIEVLLEDINRIKSINLVAGNGVVAYFQIFVHVFK